MLPTCPAAITGTPCKATPLLVASPIVVPADFHALMTSSALGASVAPNTVGTTRLSSELTIPGALMVECFLSIGGFRGRRTGYDAPTQMQR